MKLGDILIPVTKQSITGMASKNLDTYLREGDRVLVITDISILGREIPTKPKTGEQDEYERAMRDIRAAVEQAIEVTVLRKSQLFGDCVTVDIGLNSKQIQLLGPQDGVYILKDRIPAFGDWHFREDALETRRGFDSVRDRDIDTSEIEPIRDPSVVDLKNSLADLIGQNDQGRVTFAQKNDVRTFTRNLDSNPDSGRMLEKFAADCRSFGLEMSFNETGARTGWLHISCPDAKVDDLQQIFVSLGGDVFGAALRVSKNFDVKIDVDCGFYEVKIFCSTSFRKS